jgi:hypothetical protein
MRLFFQPKLHKDMARKGKHGRPLMYTFATRKRLAELIREHGARKTREMLSRSICVPTLLKIAKEFGIELKQGRRPRSAA